MPEPRGNWSQTELDDHGVHVYEPPEPSEHRYTVVYLHGVDQGHLSDHRAFCREFDRHGLRVVAPITGESWWTDRICPGFDPEVTAERHLLDRVVPMIADRFGAEPPRIALLGTSMGGQGQGSTSHVAPQPSPTRVSPSSHDSSTSRSPSPHGSGGGPMEIGISATLSVSSASASRFSGSAVTRRM